MSKHIYIYSPSGAVRDKPAFRRGVARLKKMGHEVEVDTDALSSHQRFAGDDATRLASIHRAASSGADVALITRGGYGLTRILPGVDYKKVARAIDGGLLFVGISDFTVLQCALQAKTGAITWAGPALCEGFGVQSPHDSVALTEPDEIMQACFEDLLSGQAEGTGWRQSRIPVSGVKTPTPSQPELRIHNATLWGGNLTMLTTLLGTPFFPEVKGGVLFLEDTGEHPYRIERMLTQLLHAGVLARQKAIVFGQFTDYKLVAHDKGFKLPTVLDWLRSQVKTPILTNLPYGHVQTKVLLPVGARVDLVTDARDVIMVWGHV